MLTVPSFFLNSLGDMTLLDGAIHMPPTAVRAAQERRQRTDIAMAQVNLADDNGWVTRETHVECTLK